MHKIMIAAAALVLTVGLAGCSGNDGAGRTRAEGSQVEVETAPTETKAPTPVENIDKTWTFDYQGAKGTFKLTGDATNPEVAAVEAARATVNGEAVTLVPVEIDNTAGTEGINMYGLTVVTKDGQQVTSADLSDYFTKWRDDAGDDTDKYNALIDAGNAHDAFDLQPGAKGTALVAFAEPLTSAWRVTVMPAGASAEVDASAS